MTCHGFRAPIPFPLSAAGMGPSSPQPPARPGGGTPGVPLASEYSAQVRAAPSDDEGPRPWRVRPATSGKYEIVDANGVRLNVTGDYDPLDYIVGIVNEAGI